MGKKFQEFEARTTKELPQEQQIKKKKMIQERLDKELSKLADQKLEEDKLLK